MRVLYNILFIMGFIVYLPALVYRMILFCKYRSGLLQRFGIFSETIKQRIIKQDNIWIHAASVGEVLAVFPLIDELRSYFNNHRIIISTLTGTGREIAVQKSKPDDLIISFPLDFNFVVKNVLNLIKPKLIVLVESELWPNFIYNAKKMEAKLVLVNGRISDRSFRRYMHFRFFIKENLNKFSLLSCQTTEDSDRLKKMGANDQLVHTAGNMKFEIGSMHEHQDQDKKYWKNLFGFSEDDVVLLGGSTHDGEENVLIEIFKKLRWKYPNLKLILAPRHPERFNVVRKLLEDKKISFVNRSALSNLKFAKVVLLDSMGELRNIYQIANIVFIGKSLMKKGGQSPIEPAIQRKAILFGPFMNNFRGIEKQLINSNAAIKIADSNKLEEKIVDLINEPKQIQLLGERAYEIVLKNSGATKRNFLYIKQIWDNRI